MSTPYLSPPPTRRDPSGPGRWTVWVLACALVGALAGTGAALLRDAAGDDRDPGSQGGAGPLALSVPFADVPCGDHFVVMLATSGTEGDYQRKLGRATRGVDGAKYLRNSSSCDELQQRNGDAEIYTAYLGPVDSFEEACETRAGVENPLAWVRSMAEDSRRRELCMCLRFSDALPQVGPGAPAPRDLATRRAVSDLQYVLFVKGYNPERRLSGYFSDETRAMLTAYQADHDLRADGNLGAATWASLQQGYPC